METLCQRELADAANIIFSTCKAYVYVYVVGLDLFF